jgi:ABC-type multidrug transport system permease subunit
VKNELSPGAARLQAFLSICRANFRLFFREPEAIFWTFLFPLMLSAALGLAFRQKPAEVVPIAVLAGPQAEAVAARLKTHPSLKVAVEDAERAALDLRMGRVTVIVAPGEDGVEYRLDPSRPDSALGQRLADEALQVEAGRRDPLPTHRKEISEPGGRYVDFLLPGIIGMNLMNSGLWGVGFSLVDMRIKKLLKRMLATPLRRSDFVAAQMALRLVLICVEIPFVLLVGYWLLGVPIRGAWSSILLAGAVGAVAFGGVGMLLASRATRIETVMGLMNMVSMPMLLCSGVFFSSERFPEIVQPVIRALPLTALIDALRAIVLEGSTLASQGGRLMVVALWGAASFVVGLRIFRWN